jgi:hypothetical protein
MKKTTRRYGSFWSCPNCKDTPEFDHAGMMAHMRDAHGIDTKNTKGTQRMLMHVDGSDFFASDYEWEINGLKFNQSTCNKRDPQSAMYWS